MSSTPVIAIIGAMDVEIESLLPELNDQHAQVIGGHTFFSGTMRGQQVIVTRSGIGKVNAAVTTTVLINHFRVDKIIFTGVAGAVHPDLSPSNVVVSTGLVQHDVDLTAFGYEKGHMSGFDSRLYAVDAELVAQATEAAIEVVGADKVSQGIIATGDQFMASAEGVKALRAEYDAMAVEMEGAAVAQVAQLYNTPMVVIRTISDKADGSANVDFNETMTVTAHNSANITLKMLECLSA